MRFDQAFQKVIGHEGGHVFDPRDPGGETKYGICKRSYPDEDIKNLTLARAKQIYKRDYWDKCRCDDLPFEVRFDVFDAAVNSGVRQASIWLQRAVGAKPDGVIGNLTIKAARQIDGMTIAMRINGERLRFMTDLPTWQHFGKGWARRIAENLLR
ncbi:MAG TPA: glycosyl hydrolase 108 family protein [Methylophilaceae bacterium]